MKKTEYYQKVDEIITESLKNCGMCGQPLSTDHSCNAYMTTRQQIEEIVTYHADEGTSGYLLSNEQIDELEALTADTSKVIRVEIIDNKGRSYVNWDEKNKVTLEYQDEGRTLKVFIDKK